MGGGAGDGIGGEGAGEDGVAGEETEDAVEHDWGGWGGGREEGGDFGGGEGVG